MDIVLGAEYTSSSLLGVKKYLGESMNIIATTRQKASEIVEGTPMSWTLALVTRRFSFTEDECQYKRLRSKKEPRFRVYLKLMWMNREDKAILKRIKEDQAYTLGLLSDVDDGQR